MTTLLRALFIGGLFGLLGLPSLGLAEGGHAAWVVAGAAGAGDAQAAAKADEPTTQAENGDAPDARPKVEAPVVWAPRARRGAPAARMGGASRSADDQLVVLALVPEIDESALTLREQPSVHWHLSEDSPHAVNFTLVDPDAIDPVLDLTLPGPFAAGFHTTPLARHGGRLEVGKRYDWYVAVVPDPERRSSDSVARGAVRRVSEPELESQLAGADSERALLLLASAGIWYEAMDTAQQRVEQRPDDPTTRAERDALLTQVGIEIGDR